MFSIVDSIRGSEGSQVDLSGYAVKNETPTLIDFNQLRTIVGSKLDSNPVNHEHTVAQVTELQAKLDAKVDASQTHTTFDNINVNTINNVRIGADSGLILGPVTVVPVIKSDGVMEIGRIVDFHSTGKENEDYTARLSLTQHPITVTCNQPFIASNIKADNETRLAAVEAVLQNHYEAIMYLANLHGKSDADTTDGPIFTPE